MQKTFFIVGCQRSGTTLLRLILECHSRIQCFDEHLGYRLLRRENWANEVERELVGFKTPMLTEQFNDAVFQDYNLDPFPNRYAGYPLIFMVRDVRDTVASMVNYGVGRSSTWLDRWGIPALELKMERYPEYASQLKPILERYATGSHLRLRQAALCWRYKTNALANYQQLGFPVLCLKYEDLVTRPRAELERVCVFLGVDWEEALLQHASRAHGEVFSNGRTIGLTDPCRPIDTNSLRHWTQFSDDELEAILDVAGPTQAQFYGGEKACGSSAEP